MSRPCNPYGSGVIRADRGTTAFPRNTGRKPRNVDYRLGATAFFAIQMGCFLVWANFFPIVANRSSTAADDFLIRCDRFRIEINLFAVDAKCF